jgi:hypothetical protein
LDRVAEFGDRGWTTRHESFLFLFPERIRLSRQLRGTNRRALVCQGRVIVCMEESMVKPLARLVPALLMSATRRETIVSNAKQ